MYNNLWYASLNKPSFTPPAYVFSVVWFVLYIMIITSLILFLKSGMSKEKTFPIVVFAIQMILNFAWSPVFFLMQDLKLSFVIVILMIVLVLYTIMLFYRQSKISAYLLIPYFVWLLFAGYLNWEFLRLN